MVRDVVIFDTTLRDGEQAPGNTMTPEEKMQVARQLDALNVDVIEAGFPAASAGDYRGVQEIAAQVRRPVLAALARCTDTDIDLAGEALRPAARGRIHVFISTSTSTCSTSSRSAGTIVSSWRAPPCAAPAATPTT